MYTVLAITCHPDDMEIACAGTLLKCKERGDRVVICHLSSGNLGHVVIPPEELIPMRAAEAAKSAAMAGFEIIHSCFNDLDIYDNNKEARDKVAFVFFDQGESGMGGSAGYRKAHKNDVNQQVVFHLYGVGEGDEMLFLPSNRQRWDGDTSSTIERAFLPAEGKRVKVVEKGLVYYPADQRKFRFSYLVGAFKRSPVWGYYRFKRINDTVIDGANAEMLRRGFIKFFEE